MAATDNKRVTGTNTNIACVKRNEMTLQFRLLTKIKLLLFLS